MFWDILLFFCCFFIFSFYWMTSKRCASKAAPLNEAGDKCIKCRSNQKWRLTIQSVKVNVIWLKKTVKYITIMALNCSFEHDWLHTPDVTNISLSNHRRSQTSLHCAPIHHSLRNKSDHWKEDMDPSLKIHCEKVEYNWLYTPASV